MVWQTGDEPPSAHLLKVSGGIVTEAASEHKLIRDQEETTRQTEKDMLNKAVKAEKEKSETQERIVVPVEDAVRITPGMLEVDDRNEPTIPAGKVLIQVASSDSVSHDEIGRHIRAEKEPLASKVASEHAGVSRIVNELANTERDIIRQPEIASAAACRSEKNRPSPVPFRKNVNPSFNHENQAMKRHKLAALLVTTYIGFITTAHASAPQPVFSPEQEARIGEIAADYLVSHPEILVTVSHKLQEQQEARKQKMFALSVMENQANLLHDPDTPVYGPDNAKVAVIEFFDYQCVFCSRFAPELEKVIQAQPDVRYLFKEWPIFGGRWESSLQAAQQGLTVWQRKGRRPMSPITMPSTPPVIMKAN